MKRNNMAMGRQPNRGMPNRGTEYGMQLGFNDGPGPSANRPLAADHLQLHELDLELALLKQKRQLIEEQQNMLRADPFRRPSQYNYDQPQSYNQQYDKPHQSISTHNYAQYYDSPGPQFDRFDRKRQAGDSGWQNSSAPKRFSGPQRDMPKQPGGPGQYPKPAGRGGAFTNQPSRFQNNQRSNSGPGKPRDAWPNTNSAAKGRDFNPTKVTKSKPSPAPNKLNSYTLDERKSLVSKAASLTKKPIDQDVILHPDKPPSRQMLGRMELALGIIFKEIKELHGDSAPTIGVAPLRVIKQAIRDRVRMVMLGKPIGSGAEIVAIYRAKYPKETDAEILKLGLAAEQSKPTNKLAIRLIETGNPDKFYKVNFTKLVSRRLDEMFSNLHNLYKDKDNGKTVHEIIESVLHEEGSLLENVFDLNDSIEPKLIDEIAKATEESAGTVDESSSEVKQDESQAEAVEDNITKDNTLESTDETQDITAKSETLITDDSSMAVNETGDNKKMEEDVDAGEITEPNDKADLEDLSVLNLPKNDELNSKLAVTYRHAVKQFRANFYTGLMDTLLKRRLPQILHKYKDVMKKIICSDDEYKTTLAHVLIGAKKREKIAAEQAEIDKTTGKPAPRILPYFVKILGHPSLPKRKLMQAFLDQFNPRSIKKHKGIHNLLFVGFTEKEDFDKILAATQTSIGNCVVVITVSEKINKAIAEPQNTAKFDDSEAITIEIKDDEPVKTENESDNSCKMDTELDNQINDLLTTIREEEEEEERKEADNAKDIVKENAEAEKEVNNEPQSEETDKSAQENGGNDEKDNNAAPVASPAKATSVEAASATPADAASATPAKTAPVVTSTPNLRTRRSSRLEK